MFLSHLLVVQAVLSLAQYHEQALANWLRISADHKTFRQYRTRDLLISAILPSQATLLAPVDLLALAVMSIWCGGGIGQLVATSRAIPPPHHIHTVSSSRG